MAHAPSGYAKLGRLVADAKTVERAALRTHYERDSMQTLTVKATPRRQVNVLQHIVGYFSARLDGAARREIGELIDDYRRGIIPVVVPLTLVRHYVRQFAIGYLQMQIYLEPHPRELMLRNHV